MATRAGRAGTVAAYIAATPPGARKMLKELRAAIRSVAPKAEEMISYGIPYFSYRGRLTYIAAFKNHVSLYVVGRAKQVYAVELKPFLTSKATLRFPIGTPVPVTLIRKLVRFRMKENDAAAAKKG